MNANRPISEMLQHDGPLVSVEFFPPKSEEGGLQILEAARSLGEHLQPDFVSITYGAGGSTRERTLRYARMLKDTCGFQVMPHLTCVGSSKGELRDILNAYHREGFRNIMALRGDPPRGQPGFQAHPDGCRYANELVELIREVEPEMCVGVAGYPETHPEAPSPAHDLQNLKLKVDAGATFITTQLFFDNAHYFDFVSRCRAAGIRVPVIPGIMPALNADQVRRFCKNLPAELDDGLAAAGTDASACAAVGVDWAARQIAELMAAGVPGIHLYILNKREPALALAARLREQGIKIPRKSSAGA